MDADPRLIAARPRRRRWWPAALLACVLVVAAVVMLAVRSGTRHAPAAAPPIAPTPSPTAAPAPAPVRPTVPHDLVAAAAPTAFTLTGPRFTIKAHVCAMAPVFPLDPPGEQHHTVCWVRKGFGVMPSSNSATSYVLGHSWAEDDQEVLNRASEPATAEILHAKPAVLDGVRVYPVHVLDGYRLVLHTATGTLTYVVRDAYGVAKDRLGLVTSAMNPRVRHRVVLITCAELHHVDYHYNVVIEAYLWSSKARVASAA